MENNIMSKLMKDKKIVEEIFQFYEDDLKKLSISSRTNNQMELPNSIKGKASLLNLILKDPEVGLVWGDQIAFSQLDFYRTYLKYSNKRFAIFSKGLKGKKCRDLNLDGIPCFSQLEDFNPINYIYSVKSLYALLYVSHKSNNYKYIARNKDLIHVYSGHGFSSKHTSFFRLSTAYDYIMRNDMDSILRFIKSGIEMPIDKFLLIGGTPLGDVDVINNKNKNIKNILYAPTWEGHGNDVNFSSIIDIEKTIYGFVNKGGNFSILPHPGLGSKNDKYKMARKKLIETSKIKQVSKNNFFNWSDIMISDISGVVSEYLFTGKPIIIPVKVDSWKYQYILETDLNNYCYLWDYSNTNLDDFLLSIKDDPKYIQRMQKRESLYFGCKNDRELSLLFEKSLDLIKSVNNQRNLKKYSSLIFRKHMENKERLMKELPSDKKLQIIIEAIKSGSFYFEISELK